MKLIQKLNALGVLLSVKEGELKIKAPKGVLNAELVGQIKDQKRLLIKFLSSKSTYSNIPKAQIQDSYPTSASQQRMWILSQSEAGSRAYNMPNVVKLNGILNKDLLEQSFKTIIHRHEILRTFFKIDKRTDEIRQFIIPLSEVQFSIDYQDFSTDDNIEEYLQNKNDELFDLEKAPLIKVSLIKQKDQEFTLFLSMHHIIGDGWSMGVLVNEVMMTYSALVQGQKIQLPELSIQYKDYSSWMNTTQEKEKYKSAEEYWLNQFSGNLPVLDLPAFRNRPLVKTYNGNVVGHVFPKALLDKLTAFSNKNDVTLFMTLIAGVNVLLSKYSNQSDIIVGTPITGRGHADLENQIGLYLNTLAIRTRLNQEFGFLDLLNTEKETILDAFENQHYPFDDLIEKIELKTDTSRSGLFDVMVVLQNQNKSNPSQNDGQLIDGLGISGFELENKVSKFDLTFEFEQGESLGLGINYNTDIYDRGFIEKMIFHLEKLFSIILEQPTLALNKIDYLTLSERLEILNEFNKPAVNYLREKTIVDLFEEQANRTPLNIAVAYEGKELSYESLNAKANQLGRYLRDKYDIQPDDLVGLKLERSDEVVSTQMGILKSGGAYVPIDPAYPIRPNRVYRKR